MIAVVTRSPRLTVVSLFVGALLALVACGGGRDGAAPGPDVAPSSEDRSANDVVAASKLSQLPAFEGIPWADDMKAEQDRFSSLGSGGESPYGAYSLPDFAGRYTNVSNSERQTLSLPCDCPRRVVWLMGASTAFGLAQRDDYTIASYLVRQGAEAGLDLEVRNLAIPGKTSIEEREGLAAHLEIDEEPPDLVVFLDGFNDIIASYMYANVRDGDLLDPIRFEDAWLQDYLPLVPPPRLGDDLIPVVADHVATSYRSNQDGIRSDLGPDGPAVEFFLQPDSFVSPLQSEGLAESLNLTMAALSTQNDFARLIEATAAELGDAVHNLRPPMAELDVPVFADPTHINEQGAELVAGIMWAVIAPQLT